MRMSNVCRNIMSTSAKGFVFQGFKALGLAILVVTLAVCVTGSVAMASNSFDPYSPVSKFSAQLSGNDREIREISSVSEQQHQEFRQLAVQQASIWSDTILEGDFEAAGDTRLDRVQGIYLGGQLLAYRLTFSETAWSTSQCNYNPGDKSTLESCVSGRIVESMFVTPDLKSFERDERNFAHFEN